MIRNRSLKRREEQTSVQELKGGFSAEESYTSLLSLRLVALPG